MKSLAQSLKSKVQSLTAKDRAVHTPAPADTRLWTLNFRLITLFACLGGGFGFANLSAAEPSTLPATNPAPTQATAPATNAPTTRVLDETELLKLLTDTLQQDCVKSKGELELRLLRPWALRHVPDTSLSLRILERPNAGVTANCIVRFELRDAHRSLGQWQASLQAKVWRDVWVAQSPLKRGEVVSTADITRERRDVISVREPLADFTQGDYTLELAEPVSNGAILLARSVKLKNVIHRGQLTDALVEDGAMRVTMKVEALEDGAPGQYIRARNPQSRRDVRGKVLNEQTILLSL